jgi:hypothetical protein
MRDLYTRERKIYNFFVVFLAGDPFYSNFVELVERGIYIVLCSISTAFSMG